MIKQITRQEIIDRYERIVERWNKDGELIRLFPDKYKDICRKLEGLKNGAEYTVKDVAKDVVMDAGARICGAQQTGGINNRMVRSFKKDDYEYKTDFPEFIDKCVVNKLKQIKGGIKHDKN